MITTAAAAASERLRSIAPPASPGPLPRSCHGSPLAVS
jgi:hypothetical protein